MNTYTAVLMICFVSMSALLMFATLAMTQISEPQAHALICSKVTMCKSTINLDDCQL